MQGQGAFTTLVWYAQKNDGHCDIALLALLYNGL